MTSLVQLYMTVLPLVPQPCHSPKKTLSSLLAYNCSKSILLGAPRTYLAFLYACPLYLLSFTYSKQNQWLAISQYGFSVRQILGLKLLSDPQVYRLSEPCVLYFTPTPTPYLFWLLSGITGFLHTSRTLTCFCLGTTAPSTCYIYIYHHLTLLKQHLQKASLPHTKQPHHQSSASLPGSWLNMYILRLWTLTHSSLLPKTLVTQETSSVRLNGGKKKQTFVFPHGPRSRVILSIDNT